MKASDIREGSTYRVRVGRGDEVAVCSVRKITEKTEERESGAKVRTLFTYEAVDRASGKVYLVRTPSHFLGEVVPAPTPGALVKLVTGLAKGSLSADTIYKVKSVAKKTAVILVGKKEHRVPLDSIRCVTPEPAGKKSPARTDIPTREEMTRFIVDECTQGDADFKAKVEARCQRIAEKTLLREYNSFREPKAGEQRPDPTGTGGRIVSKPTVPAVTTATESPTATSPSPSTASETGSSVATDNDYRFNRVLERLVAQAGDDDQEVAGDAHEQLLVLALGLGISESTVEEAASWRDVADMVRDRRVMRVVDGDKIKPSRNNPDPWPTCPSALTGEPSLLYNPPPREKEGLASTLGREVCNDSSPHLIVEARAGTGKTTTLVEGLKIVLGEGTTMTPSPQQKAVWDAMALSSGKARTFCFVAFNKSIATELQGRVPVRVCAQTMHSMGFQAVKNRFGRTVKVEAYRVGNIFSELTERDIRSVRKDEKWSAILAGTERLVELCKMNLEGGESEEGLDAIVSHYEIEMTDAIREVAFPLVPLILNRCKDVKADMEIDFNDMVWLPVALDLKIPKYDVLLVDEAQDLNRCQQALAKKAGRRLILCGDPKQAIYGFTGADSQSMTRMYCELNGGAMCTCGADRTGPSAEAHANGCLALRGCDKLPLTVTRRCCKAVVREAQKLVPDFESLPDAIEGKVSRAKYPLPREKAKLLTEDEKRLNPDYTTMVQEGDFVLCRVNAPLVSQCFRFLKDGKKASIQGRDIGTGLVKMVEKFKATSVPDLVGKLSDWYKDERDKENAKRNPSEAKLIGLEDKHDCLMAFTDGVQTVDEVVGRISRVFTDEQQSPGIRLSSIHRAKGLEAKRVFLLQPEGATCPHPMAKTDWQKEQEYNLLYVATTRAIEELVYVS